MLQKKSNIIVLPKIETQDLISDAKTITQINDGFLNASALVVSFNIYVKYLTWKQYFRETLQDILL